MMTLFGDDDDGDGLVKCSNQKCEHPWKKRSEFWKGKKNGLSTWCKVCRLAYYRGKARKYAAGRTSIKISEKECSRCNKVKPCEAFNLNRSRNDGLSSWCKRCAQLYNRLHQYGITEQQFLDIYERQDGKCVICQEHIQINGINIDHCHEIDTVYDIIIVRGLSHGTCNQALGLLRENPNICRNLAIHAERCQQIKSQFDQQIGITSIQHLLNYTPTLKQTQAS